MHPMSEIDPETGRAALGTNMSDRRVIQKLDIMSWGTLMLDMLPL